MPEPDPKPTALKRDPAALSVEYHKAHKQIMLWSAVLFIWELVGVDLEKAKETGGNIGPVVTSLKSPQAIPWVLLALVIYFLMKCSIEWAQCHVDRRKIGFARVDFIFAWVVAFAAIALYVGQAISRVQLADRIQNWRIAGQVFISFVLGMSFLLGPAIPLFARYAPGDKVSGKLGAHDVRYILAFPVTLLLIILASKLFGFPIRWSIVLPGAGGIIVVMAVLVLTKDRVDTFIQTSLRPFLGKIRAKP